jgi:peptidoglycan/LPS O-acetylase OafA/YrhL
MLEQLTVQDSLGTSNQGDRRIHYIDTLRGFASVQVLLSHAMLAFFLNLALASPSSGTLIGYLAASPLFFAIDGASAVCIFFVISGYVLTPMFTYSRAGSSAIIFSRFVRLVIPAIAACGLSAILFQLFGGYNELAGAIANSQWLAEGWRPSANLWFLKDAVINGLLLGYQDSSLTQWFGFPAAFLGSMENSYVTPLWTLSIEFYGSMLVLLLARSRSRVLILVVAIVLVRTYLLCFVVGHLASRLDLGGKRLLVQWPVAAMAATIGVAICLTSHFWSPHFLVQFCEQSVQILPPCPMTKTSYLMRVYGATLFTVGLMQCPAIRRALSHEQLRALGRLSFPIYLTHWPIIFGIGSFLLVALTPWTGAYPARLMAMLASVAITILASRCFESIDQVALRVSRSWRGQKKDSE